MQIDWKQVSFVAVAGALGGFLCWVHSLATHNPLGLGCLGSLLAFLALGTGAGVLGVYLIAKTDMSAPLHALVFAMACGFAWRPVLESASALFEAQSANAAEQTIEESAGDAVRSSESVRSEDGEDQARALEEAVTRSVEALRVDPRRTHVAEDRSASLEQVVLNIQSAESLDARARINALEQIGAAAAAAGDQSVASTSMAAIAGLAEPDNVPETTKDEAVRAVENIGARGTRGRTRALQVESDVIRGKLRPGQETETKAIFDRHFPSSGPRMR